MEINLLRKIPLFFGLSTDELQFLANKIKEKTYYKGEFLFHQAEPGLNLYIVKSGAVKVFRTSETGQTNALTILGNGDFFGEMSLLDGAPRSASAQAALNTTAYILTQNAFQEVLLSYPRFALSILKALAKRLRVADEHIDNLVFYDTETRLKKVFINLINTHGVELSNDEVRLIVHISHQDLADIIGARRETVSRILSKWQTAGVIKTKGTHFNILKQWLHD